MKKVFKIAFSILAVLYPVLVFTLLVVLKLPVRVLSLCVMVLAFTFFISAGGLALAKDGRKISLSTVRPFVLSALLVASSIVCFLTNQAVFLKLYSVAVSAVMLVMFASTLIFEPTIIFRFAVLTDKSILGSVKQKRVEAYCRKVCIAWCVFFVLNGAVALYTAFWTSDTVWSVYNGGISYVLMGLMFAVEWCVRRSVNKRMPEVHTITSFKADSRKDDYVLCYEETRKSGVYKTWYDFLCDTARVRNVIKSRTADDWIIHCEDYWNFLVTFVALLQCGKIVHLTQNIADSYIKEIKSDGMEFLTDQKVPDFFCALSVEEILASPLPSEKEIRTAPAIDAEKTDIIMYTSGSTGKPKRVHQRMKEFETDNAFIISKWGDEFVSRSLVTTVSQHHIYGFLFGISLPFALGVPFRRKRITLPEEFETLTDDRYMIIATPAFLKRTVEVFADSKLPLDRCFIFTSGGAVSPELSKSVTSVFGFCPLEVYGSTETSGIAYRQQTVNGLKWTPFDNAKIWKGDDECLRIISPYIKDPEGFATADRVEIYEDGTFLLKGRADSVVKIEEKRISLPEVENRILETGLVSDVKVIALEDRRQYLAAAVELNKKGRDKFAGEKKLAVNRWFSEFLTQYFEPVVIPKKWRFVDKIPVDVQGKKHKVEIEALFKSTEDTMQENQHSIENETVVSKSDDAVTLKFTVPSSCDFYDGHFPEFKLLPAVGQFEIVTRFSKKYFNTQRFVPSARRMKFSAPVVPESVVILELSYNRPKQTVTFVMYADGNREKEFSSGTFSVLPEENA